MGDEPAPRKASEDAPVAAPVERRGAEGAEPQQPVPGATTEGAAESSPPAEGTEPHDTLASAERRAQEAEKRLLYLRADFVNYRKRMAREMQELSDFATEGLALEMLDVADNLERAVASAPQGSQSDPWRAGVEGTLKKLLSVLASQGVEPFESVGDTFDPRRHDALATVEAAGVEPGRVIEEVRRGYAMKGKVLRPAAVKVTRGTPESTPGGSAPQTGEAGDAGAPRPEDDGNG